MYYYFKDEEARGWELLQEIESPYDGARFGHSITIAGITGPPMTDMRMAIGSPDYENETGAINVYENIKGTWDPVDEIIPDFAPGVDTDFGWAIDINKNGTIVTGLPRYNGAGDESGAVAVYYLDDDMYQLHATLESSEAAAGDQLGWNVSIASDRVFAGAYLKNYSGAEQCGVVSVFDDLAIPTPQPTMTPTPDPATPTPTITPTPTATPTIRNTGVDIVMPEKDYTAGMECSCTVIVTYNESEAVQNLPLFVILDVLGTLYFAPDFSDFSYYEMDLNPGDVIDVPVLPAFNWPDGAGNASGINWYAGLTNPEMNDLLGEMDTFTFGWH